MSDTITAEELRDELASESPPMILDVREAEELGISRLTDIVHIPHDQVPHRASGLDRNANWVIVCRSGQRSKMVTQYLLALGYKSVRNLEGGMNAWAAKVDRTMLVY